MEGKESGLFLYKCLEAVGLQQHYLRLTAVGVHSAAQLSRVTMEDYPILGISSAEDRTQLLRLGQMLKSLDLWCDSDANHHAVGDGLTHCSCLAPDEDVCDLSGAGERLDFSGKTFSHHQKLCCYPAHVHVSARPDRSAQAGSGEIRTETNRRKTLERKTDTIAVYDLRTAGYNYGLPLSSPPVPNKRQPRQQRISVCVRKRPLTPTECRRGEADVVTTLSKVCVTVKERKEAVDLSQYVLQHKFYFDHVFGEESTNEEVYQRTAYPLVQHMLHRGSATCIAYGQTGAGKTHTMLGSSLEGPGLYALAVRDVFSHLSATKTHPPLLVFVSFFEIYCGQLYDLLNNRKRLFAREDGQKVVHISGLHEVRADSVSSLLQVVSHGMAGRTQGMSGVNAHSSRSHAMLQLQLRAPNQQMAGRMWFVDLAGSERASDTREPDRQSRMEGAEINQSLLALKECIRSLDQAQSHTPFRQSKLTQVLKDSFLGDSMTCMIANISPGQAATEHTLNTLRYADRVKELRRQKGQGGSRGKTVFSKQNISCNKASAVPRGKTPPKRPKLGRQGDDFVPDSSISSLTTEDTVFCSTPKNSSCTRARVGNGLEQLTPIRGFLEISGQRESPGRKDGGNEKDPVETSNHNQCISGKCHSQNVQRKLDFSERRVEKQRAILNKETRWKDQEGHEENRDTWPEIERQREIRSQKAEQKEKERHLKQYHQQLQQLIPSFDSSSGRLSSPSTCQYSCSHQVPRCSTPPAWHSSQYSVSAQAERDSDASGCKPDFETFNKTHVSSFTTEGRCIHNKDKREVGHSALGDSSKDLGALWDSRKSKHGKQRGNVEKERTLTPRDEGQFILRREYKKPVRMESGGKRRKAWLTPAGIPQTHTVTEASRDDKETLLLEASSSQSDTVGNMPVLSQGKASTDFSSDIMDPLSISLLEVDQRVATASFLQGKQSNFHLSDGGRGRDKRKVCNNFASPFPQASSESVQCSLPKWHREECSNHPSNIPVQPNSSCEAHSDEENCVFQTRPHLHLSILGDNYHAQCRVVQAHWDQMEEMETLFRREGTLLYQQPDMEFGEYIHKLGEIMARKARCVHGMIAHLQPYLKSFNQRHNHEKDNNNHNF